MLPLGRGGEVVGDTTWGASGFGAYVHGFTGIPDEFRPGGTLGMLKAREDPGSEACAEHAMGWVTAAAIIRHELGSAPP